MSKLGDVVDILSDAGRHIECVRTAVDSLEPQKADPNMTVIYTATQKIEEAIALLEKCDDEAVA